MIDPAALARHNTGVLRARAAYAADCAYAARLCLCGRRLESTSRTCRPCKRARAELKENQQ